MPRTRAHERLRGHHVSMRCAVVLWLLLLTCGAITSLHAQESAESTVDAEIATAPVELDGTVLFRVRGISSYPAEERARLIQERLQAVAADPAVQIDSLQIVEDEGVARIRAGDRPLVTLVEPDARLEQVRLVELATIHMNRIGQAIAAYRDARSPAALQRAIGWAVTATILFGLAVAAVVWLWRYIDRTLTRGLERHIRAIGIQSLTLIRGERIADAFRSGLGILRALVVLAIALVYLGFVFALFPRTRPLSDDIVGLVLRPVHEIGSAIVVSIPDIIFLVVLFFVVRFALRLIRLFFDAVGRGSVTLARFDPEWAQPTYKIIRVAIVAFGLVVAYPYIPGSHSDAFKGVTIFLGLVLSFGSSSAIANLIAGYMMTYRRAFKVGDRVKIGNVIGDVIESRLQVTHLCSFKNEELIIPNSQILASEVLNYSSIARKRGLILHTEVGIGYETPWRQVEAMLIMAAGQTPGLLTDPHPFVRLLKLEDFAVKYELNVYCANPQEMGQLYTELHRRILDVFNEYGVQIMTPAYEGDPETPKVVARKDWNAAPARPRPVDEPSDTRRSA